MAKLFPLFIIFTSMLFAQQDKTFQISKNDQGGYNIYSNTDSLLYEFTSLNTDSSTLETLDMIFSGASKNTKQTVAVINLQEKGFDSTLVAVAIISAGVPFLIFFFTNIRKNKSEWITDLRSAVNNILGGLSIYENRTMYFEIIKAHPELKEGLDVKSLVENYAIMIREMETQITSLTILLDNSISEKYLFDTINYYYSFVYELPNVYNRLHILSENLMRNEQENFEFIELEEVIRNQQIILEAYKSKIRALLKYVIMKKNNPLKTVLNNFRAYLKSDKISN